MTGDELFDRALEEARSRREQEARHRVEIEVKRAKLQAANARHAARLREAARAFAERARATGLAPEPIGIGTRTVLERRRFLGPIERQIYDTRPGWVVRAYRRPDSYGYGGVTGLYVLDDGSVYLGQVRPDDVLTDPNAPRLQVSYFDAERSPEAADGTIAPTFEQVVRDLAEFLTAKEQPN